MVDSMADYSEQEIKRMLERAEDVFAKESQLIGLSDDSVIVVGDTHGDYDSTKRALDRHEQLGGTLLFLGDYVDRGPPDYQLMNIVTLLERKLDMGDRLFMLRGNHESLEMNVLYGFYEVVKSRFSRDLYDRFLAVFSNMPYAALVNNKVLCIHGGIPKGLHNLSQIHSIPKGEKDPEYNIAFQLLWNDPREYVDEFAPSGRGGGALYFGKKVFDDFMKNNNLELLVRSHEPQVGGYSFMFGGKLLSIFSCRYYGVEPKACIIRRRETLDMVSLE